MAKLLASKYTRTGAALAAGQLSEEHAAIIVRAAEAVPAEVPADDLAYCEERLVEKATRMAPGNLLDGCWSRSHSSSPMPMRTPS